MLQNRTSLKTRDNRVDGGEASPIKNRTPIMVADGLLPLNTVLVEFDQRAVELDAMLRTFLRRHLVQYGNAKPGEIDNLQTGV